MPFMQVCFISLYVLALCENASQQTGWLLPQIAPLPVWLQQGRILQLGGVAQVFKMPWVSKTRTSTRTDRAGPVVGAKMITAC